MTDQEYNSWFLSTLKAVMIFLSSDIALTQKN